MAKIILLSQTKHVLTFLHPISLFGVAYSALVELLFKYHPPVAEGIVMPMMMKMWERQQTMIICEREEDREEKGKLG
jgi:hypothetical protein